MIQPALITLIAALVTAGGAGTSGATLISALGALVAAAGSIVTVIVGLRNKNKIQEIHLMVDGNLSDVKTKLDNMTGERDQLQKQADADTGPVPTAWKAPPPPHA